LGHAVSRLLTVHKNKKRKQSNVKNKTHTNLVICSSLALALGLAIWSPVQAQSAQPAEPKMIMEAKTKECCQGMKEQKQAMMAEIKAQDAELAAQVAQMNSAPADKKLTLLAAIVTRLVEQRTAMNARMEKMHGEMMQNMQMGKDSMSKCPMMKGMKGTDSKSPGAQEEHPAEQK